MPGSPFRDTTDFRLHKTHDFRQTFPTFDPAQTGVCRIRVYQSNRALADSPTLILATQDPNSSASITNFAEAIAGEVFRSHGGKRLFRSGGTSWSCLQNSPLWVEHYPPGTLLDPKQEWFSLVTFLPLPGGTLSTPYWRTVPRALIGRLLAPDAV